MYTEIKIISCLNSAAPGETVQVTIEVTNKYSGMLCLWIPVVALGKSTGDYDRFIDMIDEWLSSGEKKQYQGSFIMLNEDVDVGAYVYYKGDDGYYYSDDEAHKDINETELDEYYQGLAIPDWRRL